MYVCGLAMMKKVNAEITEIVNFCSCFLPSHPQPQSLNNPIFVVLCAEKKNYVVAGVVEGFKAIGEPTVN
ncbi:hypothetical protein [Dishui Lake phycodnavirus 2]|nr:hypothetical protein [Dishui Lake phycodnavirus 2]